VALHAPQDVVERADRLDDIGAFVQHDAFGAFGHRRVGDFCP
jgi:hypothetical protein